MKSKSQYKLITLTIPILIIIFYLMKNSILSFMTILPTCPFYRTYHIYCPACGNTRSITALLHGNLLIALRYNIVPTLLLVFGICAYIEFATFSFHYPIRILPRNRYFYILCFVIVILYIIFRNAIPFLTPTI